MTPLARQIRRFRDQEDGLVMTEFLILLPLLVWTFMALFIYWDAFRTINQAQKAAYSVADLISRQSEIDSNFVNGIQTVTEYLLEDSPRIGIRITSVKFKEEDNSFYVLFSRSPGNRMSVQNNATVNKSTFRERIPLMADQDSVVVVETEVEYSPGFDVGIPYSTFRNFIVTRPRDYLQVCFTGTSCPSIV